MWLLVRIVLLAAMIWIIFFQVLLFVQAPDNGMFPSVKAGDLLIGFRMERNYVKNDVVLYEKEGQIRRHAVKKEQDLYEMLDLLMRTSFYKQEYDVKAAYFSSYPEGTYSTVLILDKEGNLQRDEEDTVTFGEEELKESLSGFVLEV